MTASGNTLLTKIIKQFKTYLLICVLASFSSNVIADTKVADTKNIPVPSSISASEVEKYLRGKFEPAKHPAFVKVPIRYANRKGYYLRAEAFEAFKKMHEAARKDKIDLIIRSAARNFNYQRWIWNRKWKEKTKKIPNPKNRVKDILRFSSMPGTSRHHWGTDIDLNSFNNHWFTHGKGLKLFNWMNDNAHKYGFCRPYTAKNAKRPTGYNEEKWHWTYQPLSKAMLKDANGLLTDKKINGFAGSEHATSLAIVKNYVFGVDPSCR